MALASIFFCAGALASAPVAEPSSEYPSIVRSYGPEAGFSQINALLEGQDGYLWLGTFGGLVRFDGFKFTAFHAARQNVIQSYSNQSDSKPSDSKPSDSKDREGPSSDRIVALREDDQGRLWIGTQDGGVSLYDHGNFRQSPLCEGTCRVYALSPQTGNAILVATNVGLFRIALDSLRATAVGRASDDYAEIAIQKDGHIYVGGARKGLGRVAGNDIVPIALPQGAQFQDLASAGGLLWVKTSMGLYRFDPAQSTWTLMAVEPNAWPIESQDGQIWMSTLSGKLLHAEAPSELRPFEDLPPMHATTVWKDRSGVLWIGGSEGLWSVQTSKVMMRRNVQASLRLGSESSGRAIVGDGSGGVWEGYTCGGIRHRLEQGTYATLREPIVEAPECIGSLLQDSEGVLWAGMLDDGLRRIANGKRETVPLSRNYSNLQIWQADNGDYWLGAERHTFRVLKADDGTFRLSPPVPALEGLNVRKMVSARRGGVWFAGDHGVLRLEGERIVERWTPDQGLSSRFARAVYEDNRGVLWIGTYGGGLNRIENGKLTRYDESNGLFDDTVSCILADQTGQIWLAGNRGISVLPISSQLGFKFETLPFAVSSGSVSFEFNGGAQAACHKDAKGHLWFALVNGFAEVDPARLIEISAPQLQVHIEQVVSDGSKHDPLQTVSLGASDRLLEITYTAINLVNPEQLGFRYRMSGGDSKWIEAAGSTRSVIFQDVSWGDHVFEVQAKNRGGSWSPGATLRISRPTPWYQRQWLWPLLGLLSLLTIMWRTRDQETSNGRQERLKHIATRARQR